MKDTPEGRLEFYFTIDPVAYKAEMQKITKMINAAEADGKPIKDSNLLKPVQKEIISTSNMSKPDATETQFDRLMKTLIKNFGRDKNVDNEEIIRDLQ